MRLLDLFCGAGGAAMGYHRAGFEVVGVDIEPQPHYPFEFHQGDAMEFCEKYGRDFEVIHASPKCQRDTKLGAPWKAQDGYDYNHPDQITPTRNLLKQTGKLYVIENVPGADLINPIRLCGSSFGLRVRKHRLFELPIFLLYPPCQHYWQDNDPIFIVRNNGKYLKTGVCYVFGTGTGKGKDWAKAMDIDWMTRAELSQAIPPAYTEWLGKQIMAAVT